MKKKIWAGCFLVFTALLALFLCAACAKQVKEPVNPEKHAQATDSEQVQKQQAPAATQKTEENEAAKQDGVDLYQSEPRSMKPVECGACHKREYTRLKDSNSRHRFDCLKCHTQLHAYIPPKNNYAEIMPKCARCHGAPHGQAFTKCLQCHEDPHSPKDIPFSAVSKKIRTKGGKSIVACQVCHYEPEGKEMETYPCKHNKEMGCTGCHADKHGVKPSCLDCHEPHISGQTYADCLVCHRPHSAKHILKYPSDMNNQVCSACHSTIYENLQNNHTKHSELHCAECHETHGQIPQCQDCHGQPHGAALHKKYPNCLQCHIDPHNLPVLKK